MKIISLSLNGTEYRLCFTLGLLKEVIEERGSLYALLNNISSDDIDVQMPEVFNFGAKLIRAGAEQERESHREGYEISAEELRRTCDAIDYYDLLKAVNHCMKSSTDIKTVLKTENESKNPEASAEMK